MHYVRASILILVRSQRFQVQTGMYPLDISGNECRDVPWNVSTRVSYHAYLIFSRSHTLYSRSHTLYSRSHTLYSRSHTLYSRSHTLYSRSHTLYSRSHTLYGNEF